MESEWQLIKWSEYEGMKVFHTHKEMKFSCYKYYKYKWSFCHKLVPKHFITQLRLLGGKEQKFSKTMNYNTGVKTRGFFIFQNISKGLYRFYPDNAMTLIPECFPFNINVIKPYMQELCRELENKIQSV